MEKKNELVAENHIVVFSDQKIRRIFHENEWWFSIVDVIAALTGSSNPRRYWSDLKHKLLDEEGFLQLYEKNRTTEIDVLRW